MRKAMVRLSDIIGSTDRWVNGKYSERCDKALEESIKEHGLYEPVALLEMDDGTFKIDQGKRRIKVCRNLGMTEIPAHIFTREDVNPFYHFYFDPK